jgi:hypothetical protein
MSRQKLTPNSHGIELQDLLLIGAPESIWSLAILPHLDGAVFAARRVKLAVWREADAPDGAVVTFVDI